MSLFTRLRFLKPVDMFLNWLGGDPEETISESMGRMRKNDRSVLATGVCKILDWIEPKHCETSFDAAANPTPKEATDKILGDAR